MKLTWLDSNSWLIEIAEKRILLDPWLVGTLVFANLTWLFKSEKNSAREIPPNIDLILLSQGLEDHAHPPTLAALDHNIPVVGSPNAAKVVEKLGYSQVKSLTHNQTYTIDEQLEITALPGSPIGPQLVENGYLIKDLTTRNTLYYEPHGYHSSTLKQFAPIDVVITPLVDLKIPLLGSVIKGQKAALEVCKWLQPQVILPTAAGGDVTFSGLLMNVLQSSGTAEQLQSLLKENNQSTKVIEAKPGEVLDLKLTTII